MLHTIKINESYADAIIDGRKKFIVQFNDRGYNAGDTVGFKVYSNGTPYPLHILNYKHYTITYVYSGTGLQNGYVVFGIEQDLNYVDKNLRTI